MEAILGPNWLSEAISKASVIKYANQEGSGSFSYPPPLKFSVWGPSVASQAEVTPNGVGGYSSIRHLAQP